MTKASTYIIGDKVYALVKDNSKEFSELYGDELHQYFYTIDDALSYLNKLQGQDIDNIRINSSV